MGASAPESVASEELLDSRERTRLIFLARRKYRLSQDVAEDLLQSALVTFLEVKDRYPRVDEHTRILVGVFRNKCREHIGRTVRASRKMDTLRVRAEGEGAAIVVAKAEVTMPGGVLDQVVNDEDGRRILQALADLRPEARELLRLISEEGMTRKELMRRFSVNANTLDSRLHTYRREFRKSLGRQGVKA